MRIVNVVDEFHPYAGYENNVLSKHMVKLGHEYIILTSKVEKNKKRYINFLGVDDIEKKDKEFSKQTGVEIIRLKAKRFISGRAIWNYKLFIKTIKELKPDVVFFCGNDSFICVQFFLKNKKKIIKSEMPFGIVADSHMLEMASKNRFRTLFYAFYRKYVSPIIIKSKTTIIRWQNDSFVEKRLGIPLARSPFISFGSDSLLFYKDQIIAKKTRGDLGIEENDFLVVYTGKINESKGGMFFANSILKKLGSRRNIVFLIVASATDDYEKEVLKVFELSENRVIIKNTVPYFSLPPYYQSADLVVFPKQCSLSFYDAQACGAPVLLEDNNINVERVSHGNGFVFRQGDSEDFAEKIVSISEKNDLDTVSNNAISFIKDNYDYKKIALKCEMIFKEINKSLNLNKE